MKKYIVEMPDRFETPGTDPCLNCPIDCNANPNNCPVCHAVPFKEEEPLMEPNYSGFDFKYAPKCKRKKPRQVLR